VFAGDLGGAVESLIVVRMVLVHRHLKCVAIDRRGGGVNEPLNLVRDGSHGDIESAADVDLEGGFGKLVALQEPDGGEMEDAVDALHGVLEEIAVEDVAAVG